MRIETFFDRARFGTGLKGPPVLYHYTSWKAAVNIIRSQRFWATAHDCTNDDHELSSADVTILEVVREFETRSDGMVRRLLRLFLKTYDYTRIGAFRRAYMVCFSQQRDDPHQWRQYGDNSAGVCLGLRLFDIPEPIVPGITTAFFPVQYDKEQMRTKIENWLRHFVDVIGRAADVEENWRLALDTLNVTAAAWALTTKRVDWEPEQEVRMLYLVREGVSVTPQQHVRPNGTVKRYLDVPVTRIPRMPVEEFIVGPSQDVAAGVEQAIRLLADVKYRKPEKRVIASAAPSVPSAA